MRSNPLPLSIPRDDLLKFRSILTVYVVLRPEVDTLTQHLRATRQTNQAVTCINNSWQG